ncbi:ubiquitin carboxyl-terminal hydrolase, family 1 [Lentinula raphanica]|uniref:Ubiquitin carboxyl-terminal hydrolase n=1 Tax=Lentinula raphanica TaxID=153919 RepID=A0AA38UIK7_9AGAR|nr:ubiquitin carboxyl-terminal hydrolase, family 1 [Lentinula raphanica]KAJ3973775.1 ubiquitin carboxyl-terminal hydrolase, family 1 [Lentinula raphanica]
MSNSQSQSGHCGRRKHYIPLESNPEVFTELIHTLGVSSSLSFQDVYSLDDPDLLSLVPRPVLGLVLTFPAMEDYDKVLDEDKKNRPNYTGSGENEPVIWFEQTIGNACGLYALLHCICNGPARQYLKPDSTMSNLLTKCVPLDPLERALALEASEEVEYAHAHAGKSGYTAAPDPRDNVEHHYVAFVTSDKQTGEVYEMDGMKQGPLKTEVTLKEEEDLLSEAGQKLIKKFIEREQGRSIGFSLMALVKTE